MPTYRESYYQKNPFYAWEKYLFFKKALVNIKMHVKRAIDNTYRASCLTASIFAKLLKLSFDR
jgi:hypothetical protein